MKFNFLLPHYGIRPTGGFRVIFIYANELVKRGVDVNLIFPAACRKGVRAIPGYIRTFRDKKNKSNWFFLDKEVKSIYTISLKEKNIPDADFTVATAYETVQFLKDYSASKGKKIYFIQDLEIWAGSREKILLSWKLDMCKIVISQYLLMVGKEQGVFDLNYLPNAIEKEKYCIFNSIYNREECIVMMYSTAERKGSSYGIEAIKLVKNRRPQVKAILFGKYPVPSGLPEWIEYYENPEQGFLIKEIYNQAKVFICASEYEGWGLPAMEAMACGAAVVTTDCGGVRDFAVPDITAKVCKIHDSVGIANAALEILEDTALHKKLVLNGLEKIKEFDWSENAIKFLNIVGQNVKGRNDY